MGQDQQAGMEIRPARAAAHLSTASCTRCTVAGEVTSSWPAGKRRAGYVGPRQGLAATPLQLAQAGYSPAHTPGAMMLRRAGPSLSSLCSAGRASSIKRLRRKEPAE